MQDNRNNDIYIKQENRKKEESLSEKSKKKWWLIAVIILVVVGLIWVGVKNSDKKKKGKLIEVNNDKDKKTYIVANQGDVSPISGLVCDNWNRRPIAVMQPADVSARPAAGFSQADMVIEMPVITASITRLMAIYICNDPEEVGSMRSSRHDFIHLAKGFDAIFVHWGGSHFAKEKLNDGVIENINCNDDGGQSGGQCCFRKEGMSRGVDSGYAKFAKLLECSEEFGYSMENTFSGYPHQDEALEGDRPSSGRLRVGFAGSFGVSYDYDKTSNAYLRIWGGEEDKDRNNGERIAPKNIAVLMATSEQTEGQYNNVELGDPWYDKTDSGEAFFYFNGKEYKGKWEKDKSNINSKLLMLDENGEDIKFVPGQIWVEVLEPGQTLKWRSSEGEIQQTIIQN